MEQFYILVLDKNDRASLKNWRATASAASVAALKARQTHHDQIVVILAKAAFPAAAMDRHSLVNTRTGAVEDGTIYQVAHV